MSNTIGYEWPKQLQQWPMSNSPGSPRRFLNAIEVGVGTNAKAFLVFDQKFDRDVIVKTLSHQATHDSFITMASFRSSSKSQQDRWLKDCTVLQLIHSKSADPLPGQELVMQCYEAVTQGPDDAPFFFVLEYVGPPRPAPDKMSTGTFEVPTLDNYLLTCTDRQFVEAVPVVLEQLYRAIRFLTTGPEEKQFSLLDLHFGNVVVNGQHGEHLRLTLIDFGGAMACSDSCMIQSINSGQIAQCESVDIVNSGVSLKQSIKEREEKLQEADASETFSAVSSALTEIGLDQLMDEGSAALMTVSQALESRFFRSWKSVKGSILEYVSKPTKPSQLWLKLKLVLKTSGAKSFIARH
eukprot:GILJ01002078.1.p1 GENE.GILJ01002078.1~~GILJ01002078.1.p1  ORF type:complete len:404 (-),score=75.25 GILJ01002078.1:151-1206(-)